MRQTGFSDAAWGDVSRSYTKSACGLSDEKFSSLIDDAQAFVKRTRARNRTTDVVEVEEEDERACLVDYSGSESDCE
jgi:spermidine synthase